MTLTAGGNLIFLLVSFHFDLGIVFGKDQLVLARNTSQTLHHEGRTFLAD